MWKEARRKINGGKERCQRKWCVYRRVNVKIYGIFVSSEDKKLLKCEELLFPMSAGCIFSLGILMYEMISLHPFEKEILHTCSPDWR